MIFGQGCFSIASISELSSSANVYNFEKLSGSEYIETDENLRNRTVYEYYMKTDVVDDSLLVHTITGALAAYGYQVKIINVSGKAIVGQRGLKANEWKSVVGIYYKITEASSEIYIKVEITQDFTGGWQQDRAMELGKLICRNLQQCTKSYPIKTAETESDNVD